MRKEKRKELIFVFVLLLFDRISKIVSLRLGVAVINKGISFGITVGEYIVAFLIFAFIFLIFSLFFKKLNNFGLVMIISGGVSNLIDRLFFGGVVDFIHLASLPSFNFSDILISLGTMMVLIDMLLGKKLS